MPMSRAQQEAATATALVGRAKAGDPAAFAIEYRLERVASLAEPDIVKLQQPAPHAALRDDGRWRRRGYAPCLLRFLAARHRPEE